VSEKNKKSAKKNKTFWGKSTNIFSKKPSSRLREKIFFFFKKK
jgi:hypothetical protein